MLQNIPYPYRLLGLFLLMGLVVAFDYWRHPTKPTKLWEYSSLTLAGFMGAGFGIVNDQITCTISPAYFHYFKNVSYDAYFRWHVSQVGFEAGFFAGFLLYGIFLWVNQRRKRPLSYRALLKRAQYPMLWAMVMAISTGLLFYHFQFPTFANQITPIVPLAEVPRFMLVWGVHIGLYLGGLLGLMHGVLKLCQRTRNPSKVYL